MIKIRLFINKNPCLYRLLRFFLIKYRIIKDKKTVGIVCSKKNNLFS